MQVTMPEMGEDVNGAKLTSWMKKEGDSVHYDEDLLEVTSDKAVFCIPAPCNGIIKKILVKENESAPIDAVLCEIEETK
jgi:2-oxoglutarate dehydrogenase E2 component (dihydrolipoamide succinyltransferase)